MSEARTARGVLGVVASAAGGVKSLRTGLVEPAVDRGWRVAVHPHPDGGPLATGERRTGPPGDPDRPPGPRPPRLPSDPARTPR
ncbi:hypothetical protein [Streptomyces sp. NBC_01508]|uniref:hypothetical protein n=1 Tax=Streptomyces sp. NBC_01508 TaxID=2903888 RepID=UPI0038632754